VNRDSREFSAALVLGALGGAALAMALKSGSSRGRSRAWSDLVSGLDWREALAGLRTTAEPVLGSRGGTKIRSGIGSGFDSGSGMGAGLDALRMASQRLRELGSQVGPGRR
jgi:hypothetical protein